MQLIRLTGEEGNIPEGFSDSKLVDDFLLIILLANDGFPGLQEEEIIREFRFIVVRRHPLVRSKRGFFDNIGETLHECFGEVLPERLIPSQHHGVRFCEEFLLQLRVQLIQNNRFLLRIPITCHLPRVLQELADFVLQLLIYILLHHKVVNQKQIRLELLAL